MQAVVHFSLLRVPVLFLLLTGCKRESPTVTMV